MPLHLEVGQRIQKRFGKERIVRGAMTAPFSIACELVGPEQVLMAMLEQTAWVSELMTFTAEMCKLYGRSFATRKLGIILFDSHASPPLTYVDLYRDLILSPTAAVIHYFRQELGVPLVPYIMGGETTVLLEEIIQTGTNNILCDFKADLNFFVERLKDEPILLRANLDPAFLMIHPPEIIKEKVREILAVGRRHPRFLMGTGILPYNIAPEKVIAVREILDTDS